MAAVAVAAVSPVLLTDSVVRSVRTPYAVMCQEGGEQKQKSITAVVERARGHTHGDTSNQAYTGVRVVSLRVLHLKRPETRTREHVFH